LLFSQEIVTVPPNVIYIYIWSHTLKKRINYTCLKTNSMEQNHS